MNANLKNSNAIPPSEVEQNLSSTTPAPEEIRVALPLKTAAETAHATCPTPDLSEPPKKIRDLFDNLELLKSTPSQDGCGSPLITKLLTTVPVRNPSKESFFRAHPEHFMTALVLVRKDENAVYIVDPALEEELLGERCMQHRRLQLCVTRHGVPFVWAMRLPQDGRRDLWASTALEAGRIAVNHWVRLQPNMQLGGYEISVARITHEPVWPAASFSEIVRLAFGEVITSLDHQALKELRGEI